MWYLIIGILIVLILPLLLRLRLKTALDRDEKILFAGLGRSGIRFNFHKKEKTFLLLGKVVRTEPLFREKKPQKTKAPAKKKTAEKTKKKRSFSEIISLVPEVTKANWRYTTSLFKSARIEELNGSVRAGFESPDSTGYMYGFYTSVCGAVPGIAKRFQLIPVWDSACFEPSLRASIALPLYRFVWRTLILLIDLPLRKIVKVAIGTKERSHDG